MNVFQKTRPVTFLLCGIVFVGIFLRFYHLTTVPPALHRDEASTGYNAYSIAMTGKDEHGAYFPLVFKAFGDYKRPLNIYLTALLIPFFGLSTLSVRFPIALFGTLTVIVFYMFALKLLANRTAALICTTLFAISPWHIFMSRTGLGWNTISLFITLLAVTLFLYAKESLLRLSLTATLLGLSLFSYATSQIVTFFLIPVLAWFQTPRLKHGGNYVPGIVIFGLFTMVFLITYIPVLRTNSQGTSFMSPVYIHEHVEVPRETNINSITSKLFHNKLEAQAGRMAEYMLRILSFEFLAFNTQDNPSYSLKNIGNMYVIDLPFLVIGTVALFFSKRKTFYFLFAWLILAAFPAALTKNPYSSTRTLLMLPTLMVSTGYGIWFLVSEARRNYPRYISLSIAAISLFYLVSVMQFLEEYFVQFPVNRSAHWGVAQQETAKFVLANSGAAQEVIATNPSETLYIYLLFWGKTDPDFFRSNVLYYPETVDGFQYVKQFGTYFFRPINYNIDLTVPNRLLIDKTTDVPPYATNSSILVGNELTGEKKYVFSKIVKEIRNPDKTPGYTVIQTFLSSQ